MLRKIPYYILIVGCEQLLESIKEGCTTATACNYDVTATKDDGNCIAPQGCNEWCEGDTNWWIQSNGTMLNTEEEITNARWS